MKKIFIIMMMIILTACSSGEQVVYDAVVVDLQYFPSTLKSDVGIVIGTGDVVITSSGTSERWVVILNAGGDYVSINVRPEVFYKLSIDDTVKLICGNLYCYMEAE